jgi:CBS domain-containing protein
MIAKDIMTSNVDIIYPNTSITEAAKLMAKNDYGFLPVCDGKKLRGVITDRDIVVKVIAENKSPGESKAEEVMTDKVIYCYENDELEEISKLMKQEQIRRLVVLDNDKKLAGVISIGDIVTKNDEQEVNSDLIKDISEG